MADIIGIAPAPRGRKRHALPQVQIDMTPLVDLAFLLLTFFILTTHLIEQRAMELSMPVPGPPSPANNVLTLLVSGRGEVFGYRGEFKQGATELVALRDGELPAVLGSYIKTSADAPRTCVVKAGADASYGNVIDVLDEVDRAGITIPSVQDSLSTGERELLLRTQAH